MNKIWKWLVGIFLLLTISIFAFVMIENQTVTYLPFRLLSMYDYPFIGGIIPYFLFWGSMICSIILLVLLVVVIFYPSAKHSITLEDENGKLTIQKKAIEHFVLQIVRKEPFLENPSVKVVMRKKNIKVKIQGKMRKVIAVPQQQRLLIEEVTAELRQLLGTSDKLTTQVVLEDYQETKKSNDSRRVE